MKGLYSTDPPGKHLWKSRLIHNPTWETWSRSCPSECPHGSLGIVGIFQTVHRSRGCVQREKKQRQRPKTGKVRIQVNNTSGSSSNGKHHTRTTRFVIQYVVRRQSHRFWPRQPRTITSACDDNRGGGRGQA